MVEEINDENFDNQRNDEIAPQLQRGDLPEDYPNIQRMYVNENKLHPRSRESIDAANSTIFKELEKFRSKA